MQDRSSGASGRPHLLLLVRGYLSLDWPEEYGNPWAAVDDYVRSEPSAHEVVPEILSLLAETLEGDLIEYWIEVLQAGFIPDDGVEGIRAFLNAVVERVRDKDTAASDPEEGDGDRAPIG